jgi:glutamyl-tRNA synthetase
MIQYFDIKDVNKSASAFNPEKLLWLNQQHIMKTPVSVLAAALREQLLLLGVDTNDQSLLEGVANILRERARTLKEMAQTGLYFFREFEQFEEKAAKKNLTADAMPILAALGQALEALPDWKAQPVHEVISAVAAQFNVGMGKVAQPLRVAVCGTGVSPPIDTTVELLGRGRVLGRLQKAQRYIAD